MRAQASDGGMLPEQVWDGPDMPELELFNGRASGSAMPLVWAHAEYAKLVRSLHDGRVFDMPQQPYERYVRNRRPAAVALWTTHMRCSELRRGCRLRVQTQEAASVWWWVDDDLAPQRVETRDSTLPGVWTADLDTARLPMGAVIHLLVGATEQTIVVTA
jgi:glucoamylase